ncbi:MAG TPA: hypothetical protein VFZ68_10825 [Acidimicrobiales bacterium]
MRTFTRLASVLAVVALAGLAGVAVAPAAGAQVAEEQGDNVVVLTGRAVVRSGETVDNVVIADGPAVIDGTVRNGVIALNGDVLVRGVVEDQIVAVDGRVRIFPSGEVQGDVLSRNRPAVQGGGQFGGDWDELDPTSWVRATTIVTRIALWVAVTVSVLLLGLLLGLLAPRAPAAVHAAARERIGPVIGWGLLLTIGLPIAALLVMATLVGLPLGLVVLLALGLVYAIGYTAGAWVLGRTIASRAHPVLSFLAGWGILRVLALIPVLGGLVGFVAVVVGLGAIAVAGYRARRREPVPAREAPAEGPVGARSVDAPER